jgi:hypothetical protein
MTEQTTQPEERALTLPGPRTDAPAIYGERGEIGAMASRVKHLMPGGNKLSDDSALAVAQAAYLMDANFLTGDLYGYEDKDGKLVLVEGYKILVRWANDKSTFSTKEEPLTPEQKRLEGLDDDAIAYYVYLLRSDKREDLAMLTRCGATFREAFEIVTTRAIGVVTKADTWSRKYNKPIDPPVGWTWDQVAKKRGLKVAIRMAYGTPSPRELMAKGQQMLKEEGAAGIEVEPEDWEAARKVQADDRGKARYAILHKRSREIAQEMAELSPQEKAARLEANVRLMHGDPDFEGFGDEKPVDDTVTETDGEQGIMEGIFGEPPDDLPPEPPGKPPEKADPPPEPPASKRKKRKAAPRSVPRLVTMVVEEEAIRATKAAPRSVPSTRTAEQQAELDRIAALEEQAYHEAAAEAAAEVEADKAQLAAEIAEVERRSAESVAAHVEQRSAERSARLDKAIAAMDQAERENGDAEAKRKIEETKAELDAAIAFQEQVEREILAMQAGEIEPDLDEVFPESAAIKKQEPTKNGKPERPLSAGQIRGLVRYKAKWIPGEDRAGWTDAKRVLDREPPVDKEAQRIAALLGQAVKSEDTTEKEETAKRHAILSWILGVESASQLTKLEASAVSDWLASKENRWQIGDYARYEATAILKMCQMEQGQMELLPPM